MAFQSAATVLMKDECREYGRVRYCGWVAAAVTFVNGELEEWKGGKKPKKQKKVKGPNLRGRVLYRHSTVVQT